MIATITVTLADGTTTTATLPSLTTAWLVARAAQLSPHVSRPLTAADVAAFELAAAGHRPRYRQGPARAPEPRRSP